MPHELLDEYIASERARGVNDAEIRSALLARGWKQEEVDSAIQPHGAQAVIDRRTFSLAGLWEGRLGRWQYFVTSVLLTLLFGGLMLALGFLLSFSEGFQSADLDRPVDSKPLLAATFLSYIIFIPLQFSLVVRRCHDFGRSGWVSVLTFIPIVNIFAGLYILFRSGNAGGNQFGAPQPDRPFFRTLLNT